MDKIHQTSLLNCSTCIYGIECIGSNLAWPFPISNLKVKLYRFDSGCYIDVRYPVVPVTVSRAVKQGVGVGDHW
jgi:hypothetical protein